MRNDEGFGVSVCLFRLREFGYHLSFVPCESGGFPKEIWVARGCGDEFVDGSGWRRHVRSISKIEA